MSFIERLEYAMSKVPADEWQRRFGRSRKQMQRYLKGSDVPISVINLVAAVSGVPSDWIVAGRPSFGPSDFDLWRLSLAAPPRKSVPTFPDPEHPDDYSHLVEKHYEIVDLTGDDGEPLDFPVRHTKVGTRELAERLRSAIQAAGGRALEAQTAGKDLPRLGRNAERPEMSAAALIAIAEITGVRLEWLATGQGPRTDAEAAKSAPEAPQPAPVSPLLSDRVDLQRLVQAYRAALQVTDEAEQLMQLTLRFHDVLAAQEARGHEAATYENRSVTTTVKAP